MRSVLFDFKSAKEAWFEEASQLYQKKICGFVDFETQTLKTSKLAREGKQQKIKYEQDELSKKITKDDFVILFDERGKNLTTEQFVDVINRAELSGKKRVVYVIGGAYGVSDELRQNAAQTVAISGFVLNHLVAELVALEQIYRAYTIKNRISYHNA